MIENNLQAVIAALSVHIRDFRRQFTYESFKGVYEFCKAEMDRACKTLAPVPVPIPVHAQEEVKT